MLLEQDMRSNLQCLRSETGDMGYGTCVGSDFLSPALMNLQSPNSKQLHLRNYINRKIKKIIFDIIIRRQGVKKLYFFHFFKCLFLGTSNQK